MQAYLKKILVKFLHHARINSWPGVFLLLCCAPAAPAVELNDYTYTTESYDPNTVNPHWQSSDCGWCHSDEQAPFSPIAYEKIEALCLSCHDGKQAGIETHPTARELKSNSEYKKPENWPLVDGKLSCITCHDVKMACQMDLSQSLENSTFLRDRWVGNKEKFCQNCHVDKSFERLSPHIMIAGSRDIIQLDTRNNIDESACLFCHQKTPDRSTMKRTGQPQLRDSQLVLCKVCHRRHNKYYEPGHMFAKIPEDMQAHMYSRELLGPNTKPGKRLLARLQKAGAKPARMVPDASGRITCSTCHNPHQENVFPPGSELSYGPMWLIGPEQVKSPSTSKKMCADCHN